MSCPLLAIFRTKLPSLVLYFLLLVLTASIGDAQATESATASAAQAAAPAENAAQSKPVRNSDRRKAVKLFLAASKLFEKEQFEEAMQRYERAAELDPGNPDYALAVTVARSHLVTALIQSAAKARLRGDAASARAALARARELDPKNPQISQHLNELGDDALRGQTVPLYEQTAETAGEGAILAPTPGVHSFHLRGDRRTLVQQVFKAYGIEVTVDESLRASPARLDVDDIDFEKAAHLTELMTHSFYVPLDAHRVLVANDLKGNRDIFIRQETETVYLSGLSAAELGEVVNLAKNVFDAQQASANSSSGTVTIRAPRRSLNAFNATMSSLLDGRSQVLLEMRVIQLAHTGQRNTGVTPPQSVAAYNVYTEEQSILNANQALVQQIISSGLAAPGDTLAILGILIASGQVSSSLFSNGIALFGGGLTQSALSPGKVTANLNLNSSDSRELDQIQLRLGDGEKATLRTGSRYPIQTSSYSSIASSASTIAGLTGAGTSSSLSSLLAAYSSVANVPQVEYQDLGLTLNATPKILRNGDVALTLDMKIDALSGGSLNGNPILNNRAYSGVVTLRQGEAAAVVSQLDKSESRAVSGTPGIGEIPGLNNLSNNDKQKDYSTLLIVITPRVVRGTQAAGHSPMMRVDKNAAGR
jgi:type II secretory pathway component GspD/PulD (secretin)